MIRHLGRSLLLAGMGTLLASTTWASSLPTNLQDIGIDEKLGADLPLAQVHLRDESGRDVALGEYFQAGRPVVLILAYYGCPSLCTLVLNGAMEGFKTLSWNPGREYEVVTVSIDPRENPEIAARKKASYLQGLGRPEAASGWHFLTGNEDQIRRLAASVGFKYKFVKEENQFAHGAAIFVATPSGKLSRVLYGVEFRKQDLKLALLEASNGKIGTIVDRFLLFCYRYNPGSRRYSMVLNRVMQAGGAGTIMIFGGYLMVFWRKERRQKGV